MLKRFLAYKCEHAPEVFEVRDERYSTVTVRMASPEVVREESTG